MAATVVVNVKVNDATALTELSSLDSKIDELNKKSVNIKVKTDGSLGDAAEDAGDLAESTQETNTQLGRMFKNAARVGTALVAAFTVKAVKSALDTMKDVDTELANIRKVTGESAEYIELLGKRAYDTASKYGVSAKSFLASAAEFAKAGYSNYEQLAELAIKTQLVGDVSDTVATKFLLSADAAFKFNGSIKSLSTVLDRANVIENNYATSIQKIAEGLPRVASTAAMTNMTVDELMAAIGTITAVTQETGSKSATALRALIMNITGITGELKDEVGDLEAIINDETIGLMQKALYQYGDAAVKAAIDAGEVLDPIEAIRSLYTAYKNGDFNPRELFDELMGIGGKLRTNQLAALVENFDMFEEMLELVQNSAGSADTEVDIMLNTWQAKTNQLSNTWTEFVSHVADTSAIKGAIEQITGFLGMIDDALMKIKEPSYADEERGIAEAQKSYEDLFGINGEYREELDALRANYESLTKFDKQRLAYLTAQEEAMRGQIADAKDLTKEAKLKYLNEKTFTEELVFNPETYTYEQQLVSRAYKVLQDFNRDFGEAIVEDGSKNKRQISAALQATLDEYEGFYELVKGLRDEGVDVGKEASDFAKAYEAAMTRANQATREAAEEEKKFGELSLKDRFEYFNGKDKELEELAQMEAEEAGVEIDVPADVNFEYNLENDKGELEELAQMEADEAKNLEVGVGADTEEAEDKIEDLDGTEVTANVDADTTLAEDKIDALNGRTVTIYGNLSISGVGGLSLDTTDANAGFASAEGTKNAPGGKSLVNERGPELISDNGRAYIANGGKPAIVNLSRGAIVLTAEETKQALGASGKVGGIHAYASGLFNQTTSGKTSPVLIALPTGGLFNLGNIRTGNISIPSSGGKKGSDGGGGGGGNGGGSGGGSSSGSSSSSSPSIDWDDREKKLKEELGALDELAEWYHNQKKHTDEANTYKQAIEKLDALRREYLNAGYAETSKEVTTLANKIYDYEKDVAEAKAHSIDDLEDELDILESQIKLAENQGDLNRVLELQNEAQKKVADLIEAYRAAGFSDTSPEILKLANMGYGYASSSGSTMKDLWKNLIDALQDMKDTQDDANDLAEKQLAVDEAREALQNAQNQRTVRIFNPVTGQWEWVADAKTIKQAEESLSKAEESLLKEQQSQELAALKRAMENGGSLSDVTIGPGLSALLSGANLEQTNAFASALGLLTGGLATTADTSSKSIFDSVDSHDNVTQYTFNGVTIDAATAENMTLAQLTQLITPLALTNNMPA